LKVECAACDLFGRVCDIFGAEAAAYPGEPFRSCGRKPFGGGEGIKRRALNRCAEVFAECGDDFTDARDVVVLREDKGTERFPRVLRQNANAARKRVGRPQSLIVAEGSRQRIIVAVKIKITRPDFLVFRLPHTIQQHGIAILCDVQRTAEGHAGISVTVRYKAEALSTFKSFLDVQYRSGEDGAVLRERDLHTITSHWKGKEK